MGKERDDAQMTKPAEIIHAGLEFLCHFAKRLVERGAVRLVGSLAYQCRLPGHLAATHCALVCTVLRGERLALAIAFVFGPDGDRLGCSHCVHSLDVRLNARAAASVYWAVKFFLDFYKCC